MTQQFARSVLRDPDAIIIWPQIGNARQRRKEYRAYIRHLALLMTLTEPA